MRAAEQRRKEAHEREQNATQEWSIHKDQPAVGKLDISAFFSNHDQQSSKLGSGPNLDPTSTFHSQGRQLSYSFSLKHT